MKYYIVTTDNKTFMSRIISLENKGEFEWSHLVGAAMSFPKDVADAIVKNFCMGSRHIKVVSDEELTLTEEQKLAILLHSKFCHLNHEDGCGWHWEMEKDGSHKWDGYAHLEYLKKAQDIIKFQESM